MRVLTDGHSVRPKPVVASRGAADFLGIKIDAVTYEELFDLVDQWIADKSSRSHHVACINAYCVTLAQHNERLRRIYNSADVAGPDGMPFVRWLQWVKGTPTDRIAAPDTIAALAAESLRRGYTFYLYGGDEAMAAGMKGYLERNFPGIRIVGVRSPPFRPATAEEDAALCAEINALKPDIVCVGLGTPKQDYWIDDHLYRIRGSVIIASGATFDFFGGRVAMAPAWIRRSGFEWLYRLVGRDFKRLWRRYILYHGWFVLGFLAQLAGFRKPHGERRTRPYGRQPARPLAVRPERTWRRRRTSEG